MIQETAQKNGSEGGGKQTDLSCSGSGIVNFIFLIGECLAITGKVQGVGELEIIEQLSFSAG